MNETAKVKPFESLVEETATHDTLAKAKCALMSDVVRLQRTVENKHGKYNYVPIDDVKDALRPLLVKHGLSLSVSESNVEIKDIPSRNGTTTSLLASYGITLTHSNTSQSETDVITVILPYVGAQTAGIARSYAVKEWGKATFLLSTGEDVDDGDSTKPESYGTTKEIDPYQQPKAKAKGIYDALAADIRTHTNLDQLDNWWNSQTIAEKFRALPKDWKRYAFIEFATQSISIAESTAAAGAFKKQYASTFDRLSQDELAAIDEAVEQNKAGNGSAQS